MNRFLWLTGFAAMQAVPVGAAINFSDSLDYTGTILTGKNGGTGWKSAYALTAVKTVNAPAVALSGDVTSLMFPGVTSVGARVADTVAAGAPTDSQSRTFTNGLDFNLDNATYYVSYLVNKSADGAFNVDFTNSGGSDRWQTGVTADGRLVTGITPTADSTSAAGLVVVPNDQTTLIVAKFVSGVTVADKVYIKAFNASDTIPAGDDGLGYDLSVTNQSTAVKDSVLLLNISSGSVQLDEFRQGSTFADVAPATLTPPTITVVGGKTYHFTANTGSGIKPITLAALAVNSGGKAVLDPAANQANRQLVTAAALTLDGTAGNWTGLLDVGNNDLDLPGAVLATVVDQVRQGFDLGGGGKWDGPGGITSAAAAADATHTTAIGVIVNNDGKGNALFGTAAGQTPFDGAGPGAGDVLVKYTYFGDANLDGKVDGSDYALVDNGFLTAAGGWFNGDFNYDGVVDGSDYTLIDNAFNTQGGSLSPAGLLAATAAQVASVPEPDSWIAGLGWGLTGLLGTRRRRTCKAAL